MRLALHSIVAMHPKLLGHPTDYANRARAGRGALMSKPGQVVLREGGFGVGRDSGK